MDPRIILVFLSPRAAAFTTDHTTAAHIMWGNLLAGVAEAAKEFLCDAFLCDALFFRKS